MMLVQMNCKKKISCFPVLSITQKAVLHCRMRRGADTAFRAPTRQLQIISCHARHARGLCFTPILDQPTYDRTTTVNSRDKSQDNN